jgi:hypothetical protein
MDKTKTFVISANRSSSDENNRKSGISGIKE